MKTTKLVKRVVEISLNEEGEETEKIISMESLIMDGNQEIGNISTHNSGGSYHLYQAPIDVDTFHDGIVNLLTSL